MHPDKKVGLSLGILLIGVTAAFFFRNDVPLDQAQAPVLTDPESLDEQIRRKAQTPYLPERPAATAQNTVPVVGEALAADVMPSPSALLQTTPSTPLPNPIRPVEETPAGRIAPIPRPSVNPDELDQALAAVDVLQANDRQGAPARPGSQVDATGTVIHEVVSKDTLSGLAQQYLGSFRRYREIFEANRDQLNSPDDIREGMKLRIPTSQSAASKPSPRPPLGNTETATRPAVGEAPTTAADVPTSTADVPAASAADVPDTPGEPVKPPRPVFVRPTGSPRLPGRRTSENSGRSLSQEPPPGLPVVEDFDPDGARAVVATRPPEASGRNSSPKSPAEKE